MDIEVLKIGPRITALPIVHGSGDFAVEVRRWMLRESFDCVAVPLPASFQAPVEQAVLNLPTPSVVFQREAPQLDLQAIEEGRDDDLPTASYVPIDPCQGVIAAIRTAIGEHIPRKFIDLETARFQPITSVFPDPYALKTVSLQQFAAAVLPFIPRPSEGQHAERIEHMTAQLRELAIDRKNILFICSALDWPWVRQSFLDRQPRNIEAGDLVNDAEPFRVEPRTFYFLLGEIPFITALYEKSRADLTSDENLSVDGIKQLLIRSRTAYQQEYGQRAKKVTPHLLQVMLRYIRNLTLLERRLTPELSTVVTAAKQTIGDGYALHVLDVAKQYLNLQPNVELPQVRMGIDQAAMPDGEVLEIKNRLMGPPLIWNQIELIPKPDERDQKQWKQKWNPYSQCSWPPEDVLIENFRSAVFDRAKQVLGADLAKTEKFTTSVKDGIDIRDTLRNWHEGGIYVKVLPPNRGNLDAAVMLFDSPADPRDYPWRTTWFAEHDEESTLAFFASDFKDQAVGPGICLSTYGGAMFLFPPRAIPDIWTNPHLDFTETLEERLLAAACHYSTCPHIALLSSLPPGPAWRALARKYKKTFIHLPLGQFSDSTIQQLRMVHVLNGKQVRSYAANFIRKA